MSRANASVVVDVHAHALIPAVEELAANGGVRQAEAQRAATGMSEESLRLSAALMAGEWGRGLLDLEHRLATMDRMGVDVQALSIAPTQYYYTADEGLSVDLVAAGNEGLAALASRHPDRFVCLANVSLQAPLLAADQLRQAVHTLGMRGMMISSWAGGRDFGDPAYQPLWAAAEECGALVFIHPLGCSLGARLRLQYLSNVVGQPVETAIALSQLIFGGVLDRHPRLTVCAAHGGGYLPYYIGRSDHAYGARSDSRKPQRPPSEYLTEMYYDTIVHRADTLRLLAAVAGADRIVLGTDYPYDMGTDDPLAFIDAAGFGAAERDAIAGGTAARLLGITQEATSADLRSARQR